MPGPYLSPLEVRRIAARCEKRQAAEVGAWREAIRWGLEEAGWASAFATAQEKVSSREATELPLASPGRQDTPSSSLLLLDLSRERPEVAHHCHE